MSDDRIVLTDVSKAYGARTVIDSVGLGVSRGQFVTILGPSGCGKSTLLRIVAGLSEPDKGTVSIFGETPATACANRHVGFVPQSPALLPWRTVLDNVRLPAQLGRRRPGAEQDPAGLLAAVGLERYAGKRPHQLSGGMRQRVAIARAFAVGAGVLLMDEPFSALDELTREGLQHQLLDLWQADHSTVLFVTHSVNEAVTLSDAVVVMAGEPGRVAAIVPVELPRPRPAGVESSGAFHAATTTIRRHLAAAAPAPLRAAS